jgi:hypothetical protein
MCHDPRSARRSHFVAHSTRVRPPTPRVKQSEFEVSDNANFAFQHDAHWRNDDMTRLTIFDNGPTDTVGYSRGLLMDVNYDNMSITLIQKFANQAKTFSQFEGSLQPSTLPTKPQITSSDLATSPSSPSLTIKATSFSTSSSVRRMP